LPDFDSTRWPTRFGGSDRGIFLLAYLTGTLIVPRLPVLRQAPIFTFFSIESIDEGISSHTKKTTVWIIGVDVFMKKHCDMPVATNDRFGALTGM
jgi:hypothetical protein